MKQTKQFNNLNSFVRPSAMMFLSNLKKNNNREWFLKNKEEYLTELSRIELFAQHLLNELKKEDELETPSGKKSLHRIYRDIRFSKDKTPFKTNWSGSFTRATKLRRGGLYFQLEPGNSFVAGGFWNPSSEDLKRIRNEIAFDATPLRKILKAKSFVSNFGILKGEKIKTSPRGFDANNTAIDLLCHKQFLLIKKFTDEEVVSKSFLKETTMAFKYMRPFFDYMSEILTTDVNGISNVSY